MADLSEFAEASFSPKNWINKSCAQRAGDDSLEKFLAELEMRLQLTAEEIEVGLQESSAQAMRRIPFAVQEIYRLQGDIQGMQDQVKVLGGQVQRDAAEAAQAVAEISELDRVKHNMEAACNTLREATELSGLFIKVEEVFAVGDLPRVAEILASMRRSLSLVGDVPEFRAGRQRLHALEDRLQASVEGSLAEALARSVSGATAEETQKDEDTVRKLCGLLLAVDRLSTIEALYVNTRLANVHAIWEECSAAAPEAPASQQGSAATAWIPRFYSRLLLYFEAEAKWCSRVLPQHQHKLLMSLLLAVFAKVSKATRERLSTPPIPSVSALTLLQADTVAFARAVVDLLKPPPADHQQQQAGGSLAAAEWAEQRRSLMHSMFEPLEEKVSSYASVEQDQLRSDLESSLADMAAQEDTDGIMSRLSASIKQAFSACGAAVERCVSFTAGTELWGLLKAMDAELATYVGRLQSVVQALHDRHMGTATQQSAGGAPSVSPLGAGGDDSEELSATLRLIMVAGEAAAALAKQDAQLRAALAGVLPKLEAAAERASASAATSSPSLPSTSTAAAAAAAVAAPLLQPDPVVLRLAATPARLQRLQQLSSSLQDPRFVAMPSASSQVDAFTRAVHTTVFDALLARVRVALKPLPTSAEWKREGGSTGGVALPSFSAYPQPYVTAIGDYLMTMPQQLEVLMSEEGSTSGGGAGDEDGEELAAEWLDKVVSGAAAAYAETINAIPELSPQGGVQLAADVEYFCNVMSALHVMPPAALLTVQLFAGQASDGFAEAGRAALAEGTADAAALRMLAQQRRIALQFASGAAVAASSNTATDAL